MKHPDRKPQREGDRGTVHGGDCNISFCKNGDAVHFNRITCAYYCTRCSLGMSYRPFIFVTVGHDLDLGEMNRERAIYAEEMRKIARKAA